MTLDILIIDDKEQKIEALRQVIRPLFAEKKMVLDSASTIAEAREMMRERSYDLVILDMVIPELQDGEPSHDAGSEFLDEVFENDDVQKPLQIIGLTEYEEEFNQQQAQFRDRLWFLLFYSQKDQRWKTVLKNKVLQLFKMKRDFVDNLEGRNKFDVGVICAISEEFEQLQKAFDGCKWEDYRLSDLSWLFRITTVTTSSMRELRVIAACAEQPGVCSTSILATALYLSARVDSIFMTGITAGVDNGDLRLDDVIIAESVLDYASGKICEDNDGDISLLKEIHQINASNKLLSYAASLSRDRGVCDDLNSLFRDLNLKDGRDNVQFRTAKTVCGPFVVASGAVIEDLKSDDRKVQALDMEGYGLYLTAHKLERNALWIKAVCDFADKHKGDGHHKCCAYASAAFLYKLLREKYY